ncbi:MAG TPA: metallopeptidase family protein [Actinomycetota bacterium]|nr:metallopeptidase family protein [Actinomycetota bacterium]
MGSRGRFERLVAEAIDSLPAWVLERLENVDVVIEEEPPDDDPDLLGLYEGIPLTERGMDYAGVLPDRIVLFRRTIEAEAEDDEDLKRIVADTVVHEVAHFFGISDERLRELGWD